MNIEHRQNLERRVIRHLIRTARAAGFALVAVDDGEERQAITTERAAIDAVFGVDESRILFARPGERAHCAVIVLGNDGWDAICDGSMGEGWNDVMEQCQEYANRLCCD